MKTLDRVHLDLQEARQRWELQLIFENTGHALHLDKGMQAEDVVKELHRWADEIQHIHTQKPEWKFVSKGAPKSNHYLILLRGDQEIGAVTDYTDSLYGVCRFYFNKSIDLGDPSDMALARLRKLAGAPYPYLPALLRDISHAVGTEIPCEEIK